MNNGSILFGSNTSPGAVPGTITSANNGLSENPAGTVVLGQNTGQAGSPASFISNREIPLAGFLLNILGDDFGAGPERFQFQSGGLEIFGDAQSNPSIFAPSLTLIDVNTASQGMLIFLGDGVLPDLHFSMTNNFGYIKIIDLTGQVTITTNAAETAASPEIFFNVTGNSRLNGWTSTMRRVFDTFTAPVPVQLDMNRSIYTNFLAASNTDWNLPPANAGAEFIFYVQNNFDMNVNAFVGETIRIGVNDGVTVSSNTIGSCIHLICPIPGQWVAASAPAGVWNLL